MIAVEYRFVGEQAQGAPSWALRNSGIMVHSQSARSMGKDQDFPISIEVQLLGGSETGEKSNANVCTPGTHIEMDGKLVTSHCVNSTSKTYRGDGWVRVEAEVLGDTGIRHLIDGQVVLAYQKPQVGGGNVSNFEPEAKKDGLAAARGLHRAAEREPPDRVPQGRTAEPGRVHRPEGVELQVLLREVRQARCRYR